MRVIVGLGNPGIEYAWTPHNLGFLVVDALAEDAGIRVTRPEAKSFVGLGQIAGQEVVLAKPQTMMNLSGLAVRELLSRAECEPPDVIVVYDDIALPWGMPLWDLRTPRSIRSRQAERPAISLTTLQLEIILVTRPSPDMTTSPVADPIGAAR